MHYLQVYATPVYNYISTESTSYMCIHVYKCMHLQYICTQATSCMCIHVRIIPIHNSISENTCNVNNRHLYVRFVFSTSVHKPYLIRRVPMQHYYAFICLIDVLGHIVYMFYANNTCIYVVIHFLLLLSQQRYLISPFILGI